MSEGEHTPEVHALCVNLSMHYQDGVLIVNQVIDQGIAPITDLGQKVALQANSEQAFGSYQKWVETGRTGNLYLEHTRGLNAGVLSTDTQGRIPFILKRYQDDKGETFLLDLPAGGSLQSGHGASNVDLFHTAMREAICEELVMAGPDDALYLLPGYDVGEQLEMLLANANAALTARSQTADQLIRLLNKKDFKHANIDLSDEIADAFGNIPRCRVTINNGITSTHVEGGGALLVMHKRGGDVLWLPQIPTSAENVTTWDLEVLDIDNGGIERGVALDRKHVWLTVDQLKQYWQGEDVVGWCSTAESQGEMDINCHKQPPHVLAEQFLTLLFEPALTQESWTVS